MSVAGVVRSVLLLSAAAAAAARGEVLRGRVLDADGRPVGRAAVSAFAERPPERRLLEETRGEKPRPSAETKTDASGAFVLRLEPGVLDGAGLRVDAAGLPTLELDRLDAEDAAEELELVLASPSAFSGRVVDERGKPVAGARVALASGEAAEAGFSLAEVRTGADGGFTVANAPADEAVIAVRAEGFVPWLGQRAARQGSRTVVLARGGSLSGVVRDASGLAVAGEVVVCGQQAAETDSEGRYRFVAVPLGRAAVGVRSTRDPDLAARSDARVEAGKEAVADLHLERRASITGTVVDHRGGRPIAGARVTVNEGDASALSLSEISARTDARGRFRIGGLAARPYALSAERKGYLPASRDARASRDATASIVIPLRPAGSVTGRVVDEGGVAVAGARVMRVWVPTMRSLRDGSFSSATPSTFTRRDGTFRLGSVPPGATTLTAAKDGYAPARRDGVEVAPGRAASSVRLVLKRGAEARGRVVDADGRPVSGAEVFVSPGRSATSAGFRYSGPWDSPDKPAGVAGPDGRFSAAGLPDSPLAVRVRAAGFATRSYDALEAGPPGAPAEWKPFVLSRGAPIAGVVRNARGEPVANASLTAFAAADKLANAGCDAEGRFLFDDWAAGDSVEISVDAPGYAPQRRSVTAPAEDVAIVLTAAATIRGRVEDADTRKPIAVFSVGYRTPRTAQYFSSAAGGARRFEADDGAFELSDVTPGRVTVSASSPGYVDGELGGVEVAEGETRDGIVVGLRRGATLTGRVLDAERREGVEGAVVTWSRAGAAESARFMWMTGLATTDSPHTFATESDGTFRFEGVPRERLQLVARHPDYLETEKTLDLAAAGETELELSRGGTLAGTVVGAEGAPAESVTVALEAVGSARSEWNGDESPADASGRFAFEHLAEGRYRLIASGASGRSEPVDLVLARGQRLEGVRLVIRGGATILGQVSGLPAGRLGGLEAWAQAEGFSSDTKTDDGGAFVIRGAPPGALSITVATASLRGRVVEKTVEVPADASELPVSIVFEGESRLSGRVLRSDRGVPGAPLWIVPEPRGSGAAAASAMTDSDGRYEANGLSDGTYTLTVNADGSRAKRTVEVSGDTAFDVLLGAGRVSGVVVDDETGDPLDGANVQADSGKEDGVHRIPGALTDSSGAYEIVDLPSGEYRVTAARSSYASRTEGIAVGEDEARLDLRLRKGGGLPLHAFDAIAGLPLRSVDALAFASDGTLAFHGGVSLDETGRGEVPSLSGGTFALRLFANGYAPRALVASSPGPPVEAALSPGGLVEVRGPEPLSGQVLGADGGLYLSSPWQLDGRLAVRAPLTVWDHFAPGAYRFVAGERSWNFTVEEGKTTTLELK